MTLTRCCGNLTKMDRGNKFSCLSLAAVMFFAELSSIDSLEYHAGQSVTMNRRPSDTLAINKEHSEHVDADIEAEFPSTVSVIAASGAIQHEGHILQLRPRFQRIGMQVPTGLVIDAVAMPALPGAFLYATDIPLDKIISRLGRIRPRRQLRAIRENLMRGRTTEVGGNFSFSRFVLSDKQIKHLRLPFYA